MFGVYFTYDGEDSRDYHLIMANMSQATSDIPLSLGRDVLAGTLNRTRNVVNSMGTAFSDVLKFSISLMHDECNGQAAIFTEEEIDEIAAWLTSPDYPLLFHMYDYSTETERVVTTEEDPETGQEVEVVESVSTNVDYYRKYDYFGVFTDIDTFAVNDRIYGLTLTFVTNSPFAWSQVQSGTSAYTTDQPRTLTLDCSTSEKKREIYPIIKITPAITQQLGQQTITIKSVTDGNRQISVKVNPGDETIIDCQKTRIYNSSGSISFEDLGIGDYSEIYWLRLFYGENQIQVTGKAAVEISWREPRKVGAY